MRRQRGLARLRAVGRVTTVIAITSATAAAVVSSIVTALGAVAATQMLAP